MSSIEHSKNALIHSSITAGGSVHVGDNITSVTVARTVFSEINLEAYDDTSGYVSPRFTGKLVGEISGMTGKMVVFTAFYGFDKAGFTKHLAYKLAEDYESKGVVMQAKECFINSDYSSIATAIREHSGNCIFVLNNLTQKDVNHNLDELKEVTKNNSYCIIILVSTNQPAKDWANPHADYWFKIEQDGLYHGGAKMVNEIYEKNVLVRHLAKACDQRGLSTFKTKLKEEVEKLIPTEVNTPEQLGLFLDLFAKKPAADEKLIKSLIAQTKKKDNLIREWFFSLDDDKKLVALGLTLLNGVYADQFFSVMQQFRKEAWEPFSRTLSALDYNDMSTLMHFFSFTSGDTPALEAKFPNQRFQTLQTIWDSHRRRITATMPVLIRLIKQSASGDASSWELFGDRDKRIRLLETLAQLLSDIGRLSPQTVEPWLLQLAASGNAGVQMVAARAMAQWRESYDDPSNGKSVNKEVELFQLLDQWNRESRQLNSRTLQFLQSLPREDGQSSSRTAYVRATILLALGYASVYDNSSRLHPNIPDLVKQFSRDRNGLVISRLRDTLRLLLRNHPWQIGDRLFDLDGGDAIFNELSPAEHYAGAISAGLSDAHTDYPSDVEGLLDRWLSDCKYKRPKQPRFEVFSYREKILATVVFTYGLLDLKKTLGLTLDDAATEIENLRQNEHHFEMRRILLECILIFYQKYFREMEARHSKNIPKMDEQERKRVAKKYRETYLFERSELVGGDYEVEFEGLWMDSWRNRADRPPTPIETTLGEWLTSENENLRRISLQSFMEFSKIEAWEETKVRDYLEGLQNEQNAKHYILPKFDDSVRKSLWSGLVNWITGGSRIKEDLIPMIKEDEQMGELQVRILKEIFLEMGHKI
ncbi:MAG: hypothetical protein IPN76_22020 [Saprospiraceae bacterium]|nr:hypothetical protein [Saprospiraceae bacterium]